MIICHASDWHGCRYKNESGEVVTIFPEIEEDFDVFVMSGDFFPNSIWGANMKPEELKNEKKFQEKWMRQYANDLKKCIKNKPFIFCSGNHDFINPCNILKEYGAEVIDTDNKVVEFMNYSWYGFPYVPIMNNNWNWEKNSQDMKIEVDKFLKKLKSVNKYNNLDILIAHCPIYSILDRVRNENIGNQHMATALSYQMQTMPKLYLCGHVHESFNYTWLNNMFVSNAATSYRIIDTNNLPTK